MKYLLTCGVLFLASVTAKAEYYWQLHVTCNGQLVYVPVWYEVAKPVVNSTPLPKPVVNSTPLPKPVVRKVTVQEEFIQAVENLKKEVAELKKALGDLKEEETPLKKEETPLKKDGPTTPLKEGR